MTGIRTPNGIHSPRSTVLHRNLGLEISPNTQDVIFVSKLNILFVCGRNQWRSPTAEHLYRNDQRFRVRSAGIAQKSRKTVSQNDIEWASLILVMEQKHATAIRSRFRDFELPTIKILEIPDEYHFMEPELIELIQEGTEALLHDF